MPVRVGGLLRLRVGADVEADDDGLGRAGQRDVGLGDAADARVHDAGATSSVPSFSSAPMMASTEPCTSPLMSSGKSLRPGFLQLLHHLLERAACEPAAPSVSRRLLVAVVGDLAGAGFVLDDGDLVAGFGRAVEAQHFDRNRRTGFGDVLALVVDERADAAPCRAGDDDVADLQRAALDQHGADRAAAAFELGFDDDAFGRAVGVGLEIEHFGLQGDRFQQLVEVGALQWPRPRRPACRRPCFRPRPRAAAGRCARGSGWLAACRSC